MKYIESPSFRKSKNLELYLFSLALVVIGSLGYLIFWAS